MPTYYITVIIPSYKPKEYINKCLQSIAEQTLNHQLFEVIVVLNGCNEPYYSKIQDILNNQLNDIHTTLVQTNVGGVSNARNMALDRAQGEYIAFIDDDDYLSNSYLEELLKISGKGVIAVSNVIQIDEDTKQKTPYFLTAAYRRAIKQTQHTLFNSRSFLSSACCKLIPMTTIGKRRFRTNMANGEDSFFMFLISNKITEIRIFPTQAVYYRLYRSASVAHRSYTFVQRLRINGRLIGAYAQLLPKVITAQYNTLLYISRIVATLQNIFSRK